MSVESFQADESLLENTPLILCYGGGKLFYLSGHMVSDGMAI